MNSSDTSSWPPEPPFDPSDTSFSPSDFPPIGPSNGSQPPYDPSDTSITPSDGSVPPHDPSDPSDGSHHSGSSVTSYGSVEPPYESSHSSTYTEPSGGTSSDSSDTLLSSSSSLVSSSSSSGCHPNIDIDIVGALSFRELTEYEEDSEGGLVFLEGAQDQAYLIVHPTGCDCTRIVEWDPQLLSVEGGVNPPIVLGEEAGTVSLMVSATDVFYPDWLENNGSSDPEPPVAVASPLALRAQVAPAPTTPKTTKVTNTVVDKNGQKKGTDELKAATIEITVEPSKLEVKRDEIFDVTIKAVVAAGAVKDLVLDLDISPDSMKTEVLGSRGKTQMYDFGIVILDKDGKPKIITYPRSYPPGGKREKEGVQPNQMKVTLKKDENYTKVIKAIFNKEGKVTIIAKSSVNKITMKEKKEITVTKRMRQYADWEYPDSDEFVNDHDGTFEGANAVWADWGHGAATGGANYGLVANREIEPEIIKSVAYHESNINDHVSKNGAPAGDIMQVTPGGGKLDLESRENDWNWSSIPIPGSPFKARLNAAGTEYTKDQNGTHSVSAYIYPNPLSDRATNMGAGKMNYSVNAPGPVDVGTAAGSVKWWMRQVFKKMSNTPGLKTLTETVGPGVTAPTWWVGPPVPVGVDEGIRRSGDINQPDYMNWVKDLANTGKFTKQGTKYYLWPMLTDRKARH